MVLGLRCLGFLRWLQGLFTGWWWSLMFSIFISIGFGYFIIRFDELCEASSLFVVVVLDYSLDVVCFFGSRP